MTLNRKAICIAGGILLVASAGCRLPFREKLFAPKPSPKPSEGPLTRPARGTRANTGLLSEMISVVLPRKPEATDGYYALVSAMNQGATLEGVYRGLVYTEEYLALETSGPFATTAQLRAFAEELVLIERDLATPTRFDAKSAAPRERILPPAAGDIAETRYPSPKEKASATDSKERAKPQDISIENYLRTFSKTRLYTLKRVLCEEALKAIAEHEAKGPEALANWYAGWVSKQAETGVDFGLPERNRQDVAFHHDWSLRQGPDLLTWEVLNRLHRVINAKGAPQPAPSKAPAGDEKKGQKK